MAIYDVLKRKRTLKFPVEITKIYKVFEYNKTNITYLNLLHSVLFSGSEKYPDSYSITRKQLELYSLKLSETVKGYGKFVLSTFSTIYLREELIKEIGYRKKVLEFLEELIFNPKVYSNKFDEELFYREKENYMIDLKNQKKDQSKYADTKLNEIIFKGTEYEGSSLGSLEILEQITPESLYQFYNEVFLPAKTYRYEIGDFIEEKIDFKNFEIQRLEKSSDFISSYEENFDIEQSIYTTSFLNTGDIDELTTLKIQLLSFYMGSDANSILFRRAREENGLCYYIYSFYDRLKQRMYVKTGFEYSNLKLLKEIIHSSIEDVKNSKVDVKVLEMAKRSIINSIELEIDKQETQIEREFFNDFYGLKFDLDKKKKLIADMSVKDLVEAANLFEYEAEFCIKGGKRETSQS